MKDGNRHYGEPKARVFERSQELRDVVIVARDANGEPQIWSTLDEQQTTALFEKSGVLEPTT